MSFMKAHDKYREIDLHMSERVQEVFGDPAKHQFYSCYEGFLAEDRRGPRGGIVKGRKDSCYHCGKPKEGHAETTEAL